MFAGKKSAQIREILISESAWEEMTCLFAPSLTDNEVKILKGLEGKTRILLFPAAQENTGENKSANGVLSGREAAWPVSDQPIFNEPQSEPISEATKVNELRG